MKFRTSSPRFRVSRVSVGISDVADEFWSLMRRVRRLVCEVQDMAGEARNVAVAPLPRKLLTAHHSEPIWPEGVVIIAELLQVGIEIALDDERAAEFPRDGVAAFADDLCG